MIERYNQSVLNAVRDVAVNGRVCKRSTTSEKCRLNAWKQPLHPARCRGRLSARLNQPLTATEARLPVLAEEMSLLMLDSAG